MSNDKDTPAVDDLPAVTEPAEDTTEVEQAAVAQNDELTPESAEPAVTTSPKGGRILGGLALFLSLAALGLGAYLWYRVEVQQKLEQTQSAADIGTSIKGLTQQVTGLEKQQDKLDSRQTEVDKTIKQTLQQTVEPLKKSQTDLSSSFQELTSSVEKVYADLDRSLDSWALEEIEQLLRIANHSVSLSRDVNTARAGLELADRRLQELGNPKFIEVRRLIADEITQLQGVESPDTAGLALRLSSISTVVDKFALKSQPKRAIDGGTAGAGEKQAESEWIQAGREILADLQGLVRIQNISEPAKPLLSPEKRYYLLENLRLALSGAQIALLKADTNTYRSNLEHAANWLETYFDAENKQVSQAINDLQQMRGIDLKPELPDVSASLNELQKIKRRGDSE
jgi:uncharacterized protein HemX